MPFVQPESSKPPEPGISKILALCWWILGISPNLRRYQSKINLNFAETSYQGNLPLWYLRRFNLIPRIHQHKARIFEIPGSGGFELSGWSKGIEKLYEPGKEIEIFKSTGELIEKCRYYLKNSKKREKIAQAGYKRTLKDHTYEKRFSSLFKKIGLRKNK